MILISSFADQTGPEEFLDLCLECLQPNPNDRPSMKDIIPVLSLLATQLPADEEGISEEQRRLEDEAEKAFLAEAEKSLKENQKFLEAVKEIEAEAKLTPEDLEAAKLEMEKKMKAEIEREVQQRVEEERRRLRQEMERELDTTKAILKSSMSTGEMRHMIAKPSDRKGGGGGTLKKRNSLNLEDIQHAKEELKKEGKILKKEKEELKKEEKELKKEQKQKRLSLKKKNREEALAQSRLSWGAKTGKEQLMHSMGPLRMPSKEKGEEENGDDDDENPPWKTAAANGGPNSPRGKEGAPKAVTPSISITTEPPKKETKKEKKEREKEQKKEKDRQKKEKKEREKQEKLLRAQVKKQKMLDERQHKRDQEKAATKATSSENNKKKTDSGRKEKDKDKDKDNKNSPLPITNSGILYG